MQSTCCVVGSCVLTGSVCRWRVGSLHRWHALSFQVPVRQQHLRYLWCKESTLRTIARNPKVWCWHPLVSSRSRYRKLLLLSETTLMWVGFKWGKAFMPVAWQYAQIWQSGKLNWSVRGRLQRTSGKWGGGGVVLKFRTFPNGGRGGGGGGLWKFGRPKISKKIEIPKVLRAL